MPSSSLAPNEAVEFLFIEKQLQKLLKIKPQRRVKRQIRAG
jgi:hypothetical protein